MTDELAREIEDCWSDPGPRSPQNSIGGNNNMPTISPDAYTIEIRDVIARVEELEDDQPLQGDDDLEELDRLKGLLDELRGNGGDHQWRGDWYPLTLIRDTYFTEYAQELAEDIGAINPDASWPLNRIDWGAAADDLKVDYKSVEYYRVTYWYLWGRTRSGMNAADSLLPLRRYEKALEQLEEAIAKWQVP